MDDARDDIERSVTRKLAWRLVGFAGVLYFFNWLDRVNVGFAALQMNQQLGFSATVYGWGAGLFFLSFAVFEIPSNLLLHRVGARIWIARIMITWGLVCMACALIRGPVSFYVLRFLLGMAEAGFTPGMLLYLSRWFPARHRGRAFALLFASPLLAPSIGGPISGWLLTATNGMSGLPGWQWMFIIEGIPTVLLGVVTLFYLPEHPRHASWLSPAERTWLEGTLEREHRAAPPVVHGGVAPFLADRRLWALVAIYFFWSFSGYAIVLWLPLIIRGATSLTPFQIGLVNSLPFFCAIAGEILVGRWSDRTGNRKGPIVVFAVLAAVGLVASATIGASLLGLVVLCATAFCIWAQQPVFWTLPSTYLGGRSAASGLALVNMAAGVGGFIGPPVVGMVKDATDSYTAGLFFIGAMALVVAGIAFAMRIERSPVLAAAE